MQQKLIENEKKAQKMIVGQVGQVLDLLSKHFEILAQQTGGHSIPIVQIRQSIKVVKEGYYKGAGMDITKESSANMPSEPGQSSTIAE